MGKGETVCRQCGALVQDIAIGPYQIKRFLGSGKGHQAYLAVQEKQAQPVLVKLFLPEAASRHLWERAWQEMHLLAGFHHPSILPVLNCIVWNPDLGGPGGPAPEAQSASGQGPGYLVVVYQYAPVYLQHLIPGKSPNRLNDASITTNRLLHILEQIVSALTLAHSQGLVHGALEPGNVLLNASLERVWVADFGLARLQIPRDPFLAPELLVISKVCEQRGDITPYWEGVTPASDQYMLAVLCYQLFLPTLPAATLRRILPVLRHASEEEPGRRFRRVLDFFAALTAAFGVPSPFVDNAYSPGQAEPSTSTTGLSASTSRPLFLSPTASASAPLQQAAQLEQTAGRYFMEGDYQAAERTYVQATHLNPDSASLWAGLADTYFALERYEASLDAYAKSLELDPNNADVWFNRATVLELSGRADQAALDYERAEQLRAENERHTQ